jgi:S-adenosylmethionine:tRNA ribosyltransferase-isomerase
MTFDLSEFTYALPADRIASHPMEQRDQSRLLVFEGGSIRHERFDSLATQLPPHALLVFNNTKVIPARLLFRKDTGAGIEILLLEPLSPSPLLAMAMLEESHATWKCAIGNLKKWKDGVILRKVIDGVTLEAELTDREKGHVALRWTGGLSFATTISRFGDVPLPPYIRRDADAGDRERYQTVYSCSEGAVAAPTAGLHFTQEVLQSLTARGIATDFLTLHVSAGTFQPIKTGSIQEHRMHAEQVVVSANNIKNLLRQPFVIAVGTTSMRTLESLYWFGVKLIHDPDAEFVISQHEPSLHGSSLPAPTDALNAVLTHLKNTGRYTITGETSIYILPGYTFRICRGLITNFHQPGSTLIVLVAAFIGSAWRDVYNEALRHGYRFLSYGDSSLLII